MRNFLYFNPIVYVDMKSYNNVMHAPNNSTTTDDIITFGNRCIGKCGYALAIRGIGVKVQCECCGSTVHKTGLRRHQQTQNVGIIEIQHLMYQPV